MIIIYIYKTNRVKTTDTVCTVTPYTQYTSRAAIGICNMGVAQFLLILTFHSVSLAAVFSPHLVWSNSYLSDDSAFLLPPRQPNAPVVTQGGGITHSEAVLGALLEKKRNYYL